MVRSATKRALENKEEGGEVEEEEVEEAENGERVDEVERQKRGEKEREKTRRVPRGRFAAGIIGVSSLPTGHNGPSWRVAKRPLLGW